MTVGQDSTKGESSQRTPIEYCLQNTVKLRQRDSMMVLQNSVKLYIVNPIRVICGW